MKRLILMLLCFAFLLSGCGKKPTNDLKTEEQHDNSGHRVVLYSDSKIIPISYSLDGNLQIEPGTYWYYELESGLEPSKGAQFETYSAKNMKASSLCSFEKLQKKKCFAVNGDWPLFRSFKYSSYDEKEQDKLPDQLMESVKNTIKSLGIEETDSRIDEIWNYEGESLVAGCYGDENRSFLCRVTDDNSQMLWNDTGNLEITPIMMDLNGSGRYSLVLFCQGDYREFKVFETKEDQFVFRYSIIY